MNTILMLILLIIVTADRRSVITAGMLVMEFINCTICSNFHINFNHPKGELCTLSLQLVGKTEKKNDKEQYARVRLSFVTAL